ncbi:MAG: carboxypeptidase regulatory-like domain-containing protein [Xanthobacteraceae bacterium]|nr:carboxypeptidase regulatory-like domain-containing protein [Xanthobacteraceae bacterium]
MRIEGILRALFAASASLLASISSAASQAPPAAPALIGQITSAQEGAMEGVVVSARKDGSTITISVVSDGEGRYAFPAAKLLGGHYTLAVRAAGYDLDGAAAADVVPDLTTAVDLKLRPTENLPEQLTNSEWIESVPGAPETKKLFLGCTDCHTVQRIIESNHTAAEFLQAFGRMAGYYPGAWPEQPQRLVGDARRPALPAGREKEFADYLASINLSKVATHPYPLKTFARPTGRATRVIITEYDLPRKIIQPHDVIVDNDGMVWFSHFGEQFLSKLDPKTGAVTDFPIPEQKPGFPTGTLDLEADEDGNLWIGLMYQSGIAKFDRKTEKLTIFPIPPEWQKNTTQQAHISPTASKVDGKIWVKNSAGSLIWRLDIATGHYENVGAFDIPGTNKRITIYGINADLQNNLYILDFGYDNGGIGRIDARTKQLTYFKSPTPDTRARRGKVDTENRLWFGEYGGNAIGMLDPKTGTISEWRLPTPWSAPYDAVLDRNGEVWTGSVMSDRVARLDPRTGQFVEYLLPRETNIRRVFVDNSTTPVTFWVGSNHGASIVKVEPLE